jgi:hypothetical protein
MKLIVLLLGLLLLGGCASDPALMDRAATLSYQDGQASPSQWEQAAIRKYHGSPADRDGMSPQEYRDSVIYRELAADDDNFGQFVRELRSERAGGNIATDLALITLNGLGVVTGGAHTKQLLAAISGGLIGAKGSVDKELFNLEAMSAILSRMRAARLQALVPIKAGLAQSPADYPLEQALFDLRAYLNAGTLSGTLAAISNDAGEKSEDARQQIREYTRDTVYRDAQVQRDALRKRIHALSDQQALHLTLLMHRHFSERSQAFQNDLTSINPSSSRFKDPKVARAFLLYWVEHETGAPDIMKEWSDELDLAEKG